MSVNHQLLSVVDIILSVALIGLILLQSKGAGIGSTFGGESAMYRTKRGAEKMLFYLTIIVSVLFFVSTIAGFVL